MNPRSILAIALQKRLLPASFTILSDDCFGGQLQRQLGLEYTSPTTGIGMNAHNFMDLVVNIHKPDAGELTFIDDSPYSYPVGSTPYVKLIHFFYDKDREVVLTKWNHRFKGIDYQNIFVKIDFGKPSARPEDIARWNELKLPNSLALVPPSLADQAIHNKLVIPDYSKDGAAMFNVSRKYFNVFDWLKTGQIRRTLSYQLLNTLLLDPTGPRRVKNYVFGKSKPSTIAAKPVDMPLSMVPTTGTKNARP